MAQIGSIQALRAFAALLVAFGHLQHEVQSMPAAALHGFQPIILDLTGAGVDLFFVISGFVMVYASRDLFGARDGARVFFSRRTARIVPLYWATTSLFVLAILLAPSTLSSAAPSATDIIKSYLFIPYANSGSAIIQPVYKLGWTLNYEMFFYVIFAAALFLPRRAATAAVIAVLACLALFGVWFAPVNGAVAFWTNSIILEFALGAAIATLHIEGLRLRGGVSLGFAAASCLGFALTYYCSADVYGVWRPLLWGLPAALIVAGAALGQGSLPSDRFSRFTVALGDASYAIYLLHPIMIRALRIAWDRSGASATLNPWLFIALALAIIGFAAMIVYRCFERPLTRRMQDLLGVQPTSRISSAVLFRPA